MQSGIVDRLSDALAGVLSQTLVKRKDGMGRIAIFELLLNNNAVKNNLKKREIEQIQNIIETSSQNGMITMKQYVKKLLDRQVIDQKEADQVINSRVV
jgi:twitching motility protein PilT